LFPPLVPVASVHRIPIHSLQAREQHLQQAASQDILVGCLAALKRGVNHFLGTLARLLILPLTASSEEDFRVISNGDVKVRIKHADAFDQHLVDRVYLALKNWKGKGQGVCITLCLPRGCKDWLKTVHEMSDECVD